MVRNIESQTIQESATRPSHRATADELVVLLAAPSTHLGALADRLRSGADIGSVYTVTSIEEALIHLEAGGVDCVVSDLELEDGDGVELLERIQARDADVPFVCWTADGDEAAASELIAAGVTDYVPRPLPGGDESEPVTARIHRAVRQRATNRKGSELTALRDLHIRLARAETIDDGLHTAVTDVCEVTAWAYGELWVPDGAGEKLVHAKSYVLEEAHRQFIDVTKTTTFQLGEGLPGRVWATRDSEWIHDVSELAPNRYIRSGLAERSDFRAAFAVPVVAEGDVEAVLAYYLTERRRSDERLRTIVETVAAGFSRLVATKRLEATIEHDGQDATSDGTREQGLETNRTRYRTLLETIPHPITVTDGERVRSST